ncbi:MAG: hypothetical protein KKF44_05970 [Nanoarchaeota archaeon]|nr:hypothetical protein [Nanoarchaeota archaeon]
MKKRLSTKKKARGKSFFSIDILKKVIMGLVILFIASFYINPKILIFVALAIVFNAKLVDFQFKRGMPTDLELSTFSTIVITQAFGLKWGLFVAVSTKLIASFYSGGMLADHFLMIFTYCLAAVAASFFPYANTFTLGIIITIMNNIILFGMSMKILNLGITENIAYTGTNFCFNIVVFSIFGTFVRSLL